MSDLTTSAEYDELFKSRFTADDEEFVTYLNKRSPSPPVFEQWYSRSDRPMISRNFRKFPESHRPTRGNEHSRSRSRSPL